jgi:hypothetical protein
MITYPKIEEMLEESKLDEYSNAQASIINGAKSKYEENTSDNNVTVYKVSDLINEGYMDKNEKNPVTGKKYKSTDKVLVVNDDGNIKIYYMNGDLLLDVIKSKDDKDGLYLENDEYIYKGENALNYVSFNQEIYRIIKVDKEGYAYLIKDECSSKISSKGIESYLSSSYQDNYNKNIKDLIKEENMVLDYTSYQNSFLDNKSFIISKNDMWILKDNQYKVLDTVTNELITSSKACIKDVIKLKNGIIIEQGTGSQFNPYIINM